MRKRHWIPMQSGRRQPRSLLEFVFATRGDVRVLPQGGGGGASGKHGKSYKKRKTQPFSPATCAQPMDACAQRMDAYAQPMDAYAQPMDAYAQPMDACAQVMDACAPPVDAGDCGATEAPESALILAADEAEQPPASCYADSEDFDWDLLQRLLQVPPDKAFCTKGGISL
eukprot:scaffold964_cov261-Pinguiococcus_pyrenoidosus.AAC.3